MRLGVDVGGTFTDLVAVDGDTITVAKVPSTPADQAEGVLHGIHELGVDPSAVTRFVHGTTVATNTVLERDGARVVLVTTAGFRDVLEIGRQDRPSLYDLTVDRPPPLVPADLVVEAAERLDADGGVVTALTDDEVDRVAERVAALGPEAVAISLLFAFRDPAHEQRLGAAITARLGPVVPVTLASALLPVFREYERTSTIALNASVSPRMDRYLGSLADQLAAIGLGVPVEVMRSGGGTSTAARAAAQPVHTLLSGPAAGAWGAAAVGRAVGVDDLIAFDMGGTSTDVTLVEGGRPSTTAEGVIGGLPFAVTTTDIHTVGAGGGSIAWRDAGGALRVGPRSAGANPGPACYGRGGQEPTVTDANLALGRLDPEVRLGGRMALDAEAAHAVVTRLAGELDLDPVACAEGIVAVVEAAMVRALRVVSVERGRDPRRYTLVPFGGAGALHQAGVAAAIGSRAVLVPPHPGVLSALGLLAAPITTDAIRSLLRPTEDTDHAELERAWADLEDDARRALAEQGAEVATLRRSADMRYRGQAFELEVDASRPDLRGLAASFHAAHEERYGYAQPDEPTELVNVRVRAEGPSTQLPLPPHTGGGHPRDATLRRGRIRWEGDQLDAPVLARSQLGAASSFRGPAVVVGVDATVVVAPWQRATVDELGGLHLDEA